MVSNFTVQALRNEPLSGVFLSSGLDSMILTALAAERGTEAVLLYSRNEERRVEWESHVRSAYFDFLPVIDHLQREFFRKLKEEGLYGRSGQG